MRTFYTPTGTYQVGKFGAIPPTNPDSISESTPDFWPIFEFQALKNVGGRPIPNEACISRRWSFSTNCEIFSGQRPSAPEIWAEIWASKKSIELVEMSALFFSVCGPKFTKFGTNVREWLQFPTPFFDRRYLVLIRRYSRSNREIRNFDVLGPPNFWGEGPPNFWLTFKNYSHRRTYGKVWWRSAQRPPRLDGE